MTRASVLKLGAAPSSGSRCTNVVTGTACCQPASFSSPSTTMAATPATLVAVTSVAGGWAEAATAQSAKKMTKTPRAITELTANRRLLPHFGLQRPAAFAETSVGRGQGVTRG